ncbi:MAG: HlyD family efflux transporter periplasmic adaptor subunit [Gammaproteobacteria bacterium]|nr:HlyD family efflux transporter periplasmic adaptor subunit [Gammaproteobacteria bacterium]
MKSLLRKPFMLFVVLVLGILIAVMMVKNKAPLEHTGTEMPRKVVDVITANKIPFRARVTAYGTVEPSTLLTGMAEVSGKISYSHPLLKQGNSLPAGTTVIRIDPEDYKVTLTQTQADLATNQSTLKQLEEEEKTAQHSLKLAKRNLVVGEQELVRIQGVFEKNLVARSAVDAEEQKTLQLKQQVEELQGQLNTFESRKASVKAQIIRAEQQVKGQHTTLGRTEIKLPFDARIGEVSIEKGEFVSIGTPLFEALDIKGIEINAQLPILHMRSLVSHLDGAKFNVNSNRNIQDVLQSLELTANVRLVGGMPDAHWQARVLRMSEAIDPTRRTLGIVVGVDRPYEKIIPGKRPPLLKGMYTAVEISGPERKAMVIPRKAIHQGRVYVVNNDKKLTIKPVKIQFQQGDLAVISNGIEEGEQIIVNDIIPVIEGMPLEPMLAKKYAAKLLKQAAGTNEIYNDGGE